VPRLFLLRRLDFDLPCFTLASFEQIGETMRLMTNTRNKLYVGLGPLLGILALVLYVITLSRGAYPGESASLMVIELGLNPLGNSSHLIWSWVVNLVAGLPFGSLIFRLNLLSAVCAAGVIALFFRVVADAVWAVIPVTDQNVGVANRASLWAGVVASVALMGAMPFWYVANRFHPGAFDLLLLMVLAKLLMTFSRRSAQWAGVLFVFLYGAFAVEFATLIVFAPLVLAAILFILWMNGELRWSRVLVLAGCVLLGLLMYIPAAWTMRNSDVFQLSQGHGFWQALYYVLKSQYQLISSSLPQIGWLLVIIVGIVPWLAVLLVARRGLNEERDWGLYWLHLILTAVVIAVMFNVPFSPWRILGSWRVLVTPYVLLAFCYGYLAAYWIQFPRLFFQNAEEDERGKLWFREYGGIVPGALLLSVAIGAGVLNFPNADARPAGVLNQYAHAVVKAMTTRTWLVTDGILDSNIQLAAKEQGLPLQLLNLQQGSSALYMRHVARSFDNVRLKSLAEVDGLAFIREWMDSETNFARQVSFMSFPDLWLAASLQPVPDCVLFNGVHAMTEVDAEALWKRHQEFWSQPFIKELAGLTQKDPLLAYPAANVLRHLSMVANNLGVVLEDLGQRKQAYESYVKARELDEGNISALLNQMTMLDRGYAAADADKVRAEFKVFLKNLKQKFQIWSLSRIYGYVRMPEAYANLGMSWAFSGQPGMAVAGYKRAIELAPDRKDQLSQGLAMAYLAQDQSAEGEEILRQLIDKDPNNKGVLLSLARMAAQKSRFDEAGMLLDRAQKAGVPKDRIAMEYAVMHLAAGEPGKARIILQELVDLNPNLTSAWALLAGVFMMENDEKGLDECERKLTRAKGQDFITTVVLAQIALRRSRIVEARTYLDQALAIRPSTPLLLDLLLRLDVQEGRRDWAGGHIRSLLLLDPGHPFANQVLASMQLERKEYTQAENSLRKSLARKSDPGTMNDLAWVLQEKGQLDEAEALVRAALKANEKMGTAWDTLGVVLMKRGKLAEAEEMFRKALALTPEALSAQYHMAVTYEKKGESRKAAELADNLLVRPEGLTPEEQAELRQISRRYSQK
jgi:tetratricopeptide (TPR) repeat protein